MVEIVEFNKERPVHRTSAPPEILEMLSMENHSASSSNCPTSSAAQERTPHKILQTYCCISQTSPRFSILGLLTSLSSVKSRLIANPPLAPSALSSTALFGVAIIPTAFSPPLIAVNPLLYSVTALNGAPNNFSYRALPFPLSAVAAEAASSSGLAVGVGGSSLVASILCAAHQASSRAAGERLHP